MFSVLSDKFKQLVGKMPTACSWVRGWMSGHRSAILFRTHRGGFPMRRWLSRLTLVFMILVAAGQDQNQDLYLTNGEANGLLWRGMSPGKQRIFVTGVKYGAGAASISPLSG